MWMCKPFPTQVSFGHGGLITATVTLINTFIERIPFPSLAQACVVSGVITALKFPVSHTPGSVVLFCREQSVPQVEVRLSQDCPGSC